VSMNIGIVGCGGVANYHAMIYRLIEDANVVAVADLNIERARLFARENRLEKYFQNHLDLLEMKNLDFVDVCTPTSTHAPIALDIIKSGQNALLEKPLARNSEQCDQIVSEAGKHSVKVCVCHNQIFYPSVTKIKSMIDNNTIELVSFKTFNKENGELLPSWTATASEGGILWETGYHLAYLQLFFLKEVKEILAVGSKVKFPVYDDFCVLLRTTSRCYGTIELSWLAKKMDIFYEVDTADGKRIQIDRSSDYILNAPPKITEVALFKAKRMFSHKLTERYFRGHFRLFKSFIDSIKNDLPSPVPPMEGKKTVQLLECIQKSLDEGKVISIPN
jgi:UDP-N-acetyl-2-amino-2-deoxyglucuronate dehydrogenase